MEKPSTNGSTGSAKVTDAIVGRAMNRWPMPAQFRDQAIRSVKLLVSAADEGSYTTQAFIFETQTGAFLSTLIVAAKRLQSSSNSNLSVAIAYSVINSTAIIKPQYTIVSYRKCRRCSKCFFRRDCCCEDRTDYVPRGNTPQELETIRDMMKADQFSWFKQKISGKVTEKRVSASGVNTNRTFSLSEVVQKYLSNNQVKEEILASYNDSILSSLQAHIRALKLSSQVLKLAKVASGNLPALLSAFAKDNGFDDKSLRKQFSLGKNQSEQISYESLFTTSIGHFKKRTSARYIWILAQVIGNGSYSVNFLSVNITSQILTNVLLANGTEIEIPEAALPSKYQQLNIVRTSTFNDQGKFLDERLLTVVAAWQLQKTKTILNILRFIGGSALVPQKPRMLSYFDSQINASPSDSNRNETRKTPQGRGAILDKVNALSSAVKSAADAWKSVAKAFKTKTSKTVERTVRFGFRYFQQKSTILRAFNIPSTRAPKFLKAVALDYDLPTQSSFLLGLKYTDDFAWERVDFLYSPSMNGKYRFVTLYKNADSSAKTASFYIVDINADWQLTPDLLIVTKSRSILGGIFEKSKQTIEEVPHALTPQEGEQLLAFFNMVSMTHLASRLGFNVTLPKLT